MADDSLHLDHALLQVADLGQALRQLEERLGLEARLAARAPDHARLYFERAFLEVVVQPGAPHVGPAWALLPWFFLRFPDTPEARRDRLVKAGFTPSLQIFEGDDGCWTELRVEAPRATPLPMLRHVPDDGRPRARGPVQPCGAFRLAGLVVLTPELDTTAEMYRRLLGLERLPEGFTDRVLGARRMDMPLTQGRIALVQPDGPGFAAATLSTRGPGPMAVLLAVESFWQPEELIHRLGIHTERGLTPRGAELWIDPRETSGVPFGFVEELPPVAP